MSDDTDGKLVIAGTVAPGFEAVRELYEHNMRTLAERNTQLCAYVGEEKVVDLWASTTGDPGFSADSLINVFSSSKNFEAIAMASLVDKGLLDYNAKVSDYWPEFAAHGKAAVTVADLMRHEAGLAAFDQTLEVADLWVENIKQNSVGSVVENQKQRFREGAGNRREYHAITRGWIANEIFRRVDPKGRTIGEFLREEISDPLQADAIIGVREEEMGRISGVSPLGIGLQFRESLKPRFLGRRIECNLFQLAAKALGLVLAMRSSTARKAPPPVGRVKGAGDAGRFFNEPDVRRGEYPSANSHCSARGLARIAAMMANRGSWAGKSFIGEAAWDALHEAPVQADMGFVDTTFTQGGVALFTQTTPESRKIDRAANQGREGFYGWMGLGGSVFQWHPEYRIGFGYVPTSLYVVDVVNERGKAYQAEIVSCIKRNR